MSRGTGTATHLSANPYFIAASRDGLASQPGRTGRSEFSDLDCWVTELALFGCPCGSRMFGFFGVGGSLVNDGGLRLCSDEYVTVTDDQWGVRFCGFVRNNHSISIISGN